MGVQAGRKTGAPRPYVRNTNVLRTEVETADGRFEIFDFAPRILQGLKVDAPVEISRLLRPLEGTPRLRVRFDPRPDYARARVEIVASGRARSGGRPDPPASAVQPARAAHPGRRRRADRSAGVFLAQRRQAAVVDSGPAAEIALEQTIRGWRVWAKTTNLPSFAPEAVLRSALCLKLHAFNDTGAIIAAATTSIPEAIGSERTWDYRYCWLRDAAFVVEALRRLSHLAEGEAFVRFLREMADSGPLQPIYGITGKRNLDEEILPSLRGYDGIGPVRIGNAAYDQRQHDVDGEMVLCLETILTDPRVVWEDPSLAPLLERLVEEAIASARSRTPVSGNIERSRATTPSPRRCAGWRRIAAPSSPIFSACPSARASGGRGTRREAAHPQARLQRGARLLHAVA